MTSALYKCFRLVCDTHVSWDTFKIKVQHKHGGNCDKGGQKPLLYDFLMICVCFAYHCHTFIWLFLGVLYVFFLFFLGSIQLRGTFCLFVAVLSLFAVCVFPQLFSFCVFFVCGLSFFLSLHIFAVPFV